MPIRSIPQKIQIITVSVIIVILLVLGAVLSGVSSAQKQAVSAEPAPTEEVAEAEPASEAPAAELSEE